jgi:hypothetical protein
MKYLLVSILFIVLGCGHKSPPPLTVFKVHAVHNTCTNVWAVKTWGALPAGTVTSNLQNYYEGGIDHYFGNNGAIFDSSDQANLGDEYQFTDSVTAMKIYNSYHRRIFIWDSIIHRQRFVDDSIFTCKHSYQ